MSASDYKLKKLDVSNWNTSKLESALGIFQDCSGLTEIDVAKWDTNNLTCSQAMFNFCSGLNVLDLSNFNTSKVTDFRWMFNGCYNLTTIYVKEYDSETDTGWTTKSANSSYNTTSMFENDSKLVGGNGTTYDANKRTIEYATIDTAETPGYFTNINDKPTE